ncbi:hypothetical protein GX411_00810 [Candidatus Fermentibacteria bacterium]|nr:hypothetical protein [Candidatus Fermentibacteria bacterium]
MERVLQAALCFLVAFFQVSSADAQFWSRIGPEGGYFKDFAFAGTTVIAGSDDSGGLWRTPDGGATWQCISSGLKDMTGWTIEISPFDPEVVFACDAYGRWGLMRSDDGGSTWEQRTGGLSGMSEMRVSGVVICSPDAESLLISTGMDPGGDPARPGNGVFASSDGGISWFPAGLQGMTVPCIARAANGKVFAGTHGSGLWKTGSDTGWAPVTDIPADAVVWQIDACGPIVAAATLGDGIYLSTDTGASFYGFLPGQFCFDVDIARTYPVEVYASLVVDLVKFSSQSGAWVSVVSPPLSDSILVMGLEAEGDTVWCGLLANASPVVSLDGGASWRSLQSAPMSAFMTGIAVDPSDPDRLLASSLGSYNDCWNLPGLFESTDQGASWQRTGPAAHGLTVDFRPPGGDAVYFGTFAEGLFRSDDGGSTWSCIRPGRRVIFDVAVDPDAPLVMLESEYDLDTSSQGLYRSTDGGYFFEKVLDTLAACVAFALGGQTAYAGTPGGVYRSLDDGETWSLWRLPGVSIRTIGLVGSDVFAGGEMGHLYRLTPSGTIDVTGPWELPLNLDGVLSVGGLLFVGLSGAELDSACAQHGSAWVSSDLGETWMELTGNLGTTHIYGSGPLAVAGGKLVASTYGGGIVRLDDGASGTEPGERRSDRFLRARSNPARGVITLEVDLERSVQGEILVFDLSGRLVYTSGERMFSPGDVETVEGLSSGVYCCSFSCPDGFVSDDVVLLSGPP